MEAQKQNSVKNGRNKRRYDACLQWIIALVMYRFFDFAVAPLRMTGRRNVRHTERSLAHGKAQSKDLSVARRYAFEMMYNRFKAP